MDRTKEDTAALKTNRLPQFQVYALGGETLRPISFTIPTRRFRELLGYGADSGAQFQHYDTAAVHRVHLWAGFAAAISAMEDPSGVDLFPDQRGFCERETAPAEAGYGSIRPRTLLPDSANANTDRKRRGDREIPGRTRGPRPIGSWWSLTVLKGDSLSVRARLSQQRYQLVKLRDAKQDAERIAQPAAGPRSRNRILSRGAADAGSRGDRLVRRAP